MTESGSNRNKGFKASGKYPQSGEKDYKAENIELATYVPEYTASNECMLQHSHKKRNNSLETRAVLSIILLEPEISGVAVQSIHQKTAKNGDLLGIAR